MALRCTARGTSGWARIALISEPKTRSPPLDAEAIPGCEDAAALQVVDREGEHAPQPVDDVRSPLLVPVEDDLPVAPGAEPVPRALELGTDVEVVVDLAVEHEGEGSFLVEERLVSALEVDDREAPEAEVAGPVHDLALVVGAPVREEIAHALEDRQVGLAGRPQIEDSADSTHQSGG
jgi:hypothetical protein